MADGGGGGADGYPVDDRGSAHRGDGRRELCLHAARRHAPNAIVYGGDLLTVSQMARAGVWLNAAFIVLLTVLAVLFVPLLGGPVLPELLP